jgi:hypothetical protein
MDLRKDHEPDTRSSVRYAHVIGRNKLRRAHSARYLPPHGLQPITTAFMETEISQNNCTIM